MCAAPRSPAHTTATGADRTRPPLRRVSLWVSYDDGRTWIQTLAHKTADGWRATLHHPATLD